MSARRPSCTVPDEHPLKLRLGRPARDHRIICPRCGKPGHRAVPERGIGRPICVACAASEGGPPIHLPDCQPVEPSDHAAGAAVVRRMQVRHGLNETAVAKLLRALPVVR